MSHDAERRSRLHGIKLRALVRDHLGVDDVPEAEIFAPGAAVVYDRTAWVLLDERPDRRLGAALVWVLRHEADVDRVELVAESATGILARRADYFADPIGVWYADGRTLLPAVAEPLAPPVDPPAHHLEFRGRIEAGGATVSVEHGVLAGEVCGLEVCRVVDDDALGTTRLEVGVGAHDREAFQMLHGDVPEAESLARVVDAVAAHRRVDAPRHPLNRLAAERFIRWRVVADPSLIGLRSLEVVAPPVPRDNLKDATPCVAAGTADDGTPTVAVCSVGVDLDLVPFAADARAGVEASTGVEHDLVLVLAERDRVRVTEDLARRLARPASIATLATSG